MPRALLIDFDGVLRQWPDLEEWPAASKITEDDVRRVAFTPALLQKVTLGTITDEAWRAEIVTGVARSQSQAEAQRAVDVWSRSAGVLISEVVELLNRLPAGFRVVLATNATSRLPIDIESLGISHRFYAIANSSRIGATKPDPAYFRAAIQLAGVAPSDALFVDDTLENVASASRLGIASHHFRSPSLMAEFLGQHNALVGREL